jgi:hypothetical protein
VTSCLHFQREHFEFRSTYQPTGKSALGALEALDRNGIALPAATFAIQADRSIFDDQV